MNKWYKYILVVVTSLFLSGCSILQNNKDKDVILPAPTINCRDIVIKDNEELDFTEFCAISPSDAVLSLSEEVSKEIGEHTISYILSTGNNNNFSTGEIKYTIEKYCELNSHYDEETGGCTCDSGYVSINGGACEIKKSCGSGYTYDPSTNTCKANPKPSNSGGSSSNNNSGGNSGNSSSNSSGNSGNGGSSTPSPQPQNTSGSQVCTPSGNSQQALDNAYNQCVNVCNSHGNCEVSWNGSAYVASWN